MIYADSRYASGLVYKAKAPTTNQYELTVSRIFPVESTQFYYYIWKQRDRMEAVAASLLGDANSWWRIMDFNPEIIDGINIPVGTLIRIPNDY
jgi:hypothetical protein